MARGAKVREGEVMTMQSKPRSPGTFEGVLTGWLLGTLKWACGSQQEGHGKVNGECMQQYNAKYKLNPRHLVTVVTHSVDPLLAACSCWLCLIGYDLLQVVAAWQGKESQDAGRSLWLEWAGNHGGI